MRRRILIFISVAALLIICCFWLLSYVENDRYQPHHGRSLTVHRIHVSPTYRSEVDDQWIFSINIESGQLVLSREHRVFGAFSDEDGTTKLGWESSETIPGVGDVATLLTYNKLPPTFGRLGFAMAHHPFAEIDWAMVPFWLLVIPSLVSIFLIKNPLRRRAPGRDLNRCPQCHYDLRAHNPGATCPECGTLIPPQSAKIKQPEPRSPA